MSFHVIEGDITHAREISELHTLCFERGWSESSVLDFFQNRDARLFGIQHGSEWVCFALIIPFDLDVELVSIATRPSHRGQGLAKLVLANIIQKLSTSTPERLLLEVAEDNKSAISLYKSLGFQRDGVRPNYYRRADSSPVDAVLMSRNLTIS